MATVITGTNSEKIDSTAQQLADLRATVRVLMWVGGIAFPILISLSTFLLVKLFDTAVDVKGHEFELRQVNKQLEVLPSIQKDVRDVREGVVRLEAANKK